MTEIMRETDKQLKDMAERLRLCMLRDNMSELMNMATERRLSPRELLMFLFNKEIEQREINRIKLTTMGAHFPRLCSLENFDINAQPALEPGLVRELSKMEWLETAENIIFVGPPGVGKTHLAIGLGRKAIELGYSTPIARLCSSSSLARDTKVEALSSQVTGLRANGDWSSAIQLLLLQSLIAFFIIARRWSYKETVID